MSQRNTQSGFTLVELLVSLGVFMLLTGIVLAKYRTYDTNAKFANASEDIVLALRQAQVYGVGVRGAGVLGFEYPYGVHFEMSPLDKWDEVIIYRDDVVMDRIFGVLTDIIVERVKLGQSVSVSGLSCNGSPCTGNVANVTFNRPFPDAFINSNVYSQLTSLNSLTITITDSNTGKTATISISKAGQISLQ